MALKKDKILFWLENHAAHFGIAKLLSEKYDCESYALIACSPKQNKFFSEQKLINFEKIWFVRDHVNLKNNNPDFNKLKSLEKKFSLQLQKLVYADRSFYKYNYYHKFSDEEIFSIVQQELELYEQVLDEIQPDFIVMRTPEFQDIDIFSEVCKSKNIPLLLLTTARIGSRYKITSDPNSPLVFNKSDKNFEIKDFPSLRKYVEDFSKSHKKFLKDAQIKESNKLNILKLIFSTYSSSNINSYRDVGRTPWNTIMKGITLHMKSVARKSFLDKNTLKSFESKRPFAYFPLHMEPERSLLRKAQFFTDQINVIKNVIQSLPVEIDLFVKEHPSMQLIGWREIKYYKEIMNLPRVKLIHPSVSNLDLIRNSSLVIAIAGTTALESAFYEKPSVVFSDVDCSSLSSVFKVRYLEELPKIINQSLGTKVDLIELNQFVKSLVDSSFDTNISEIQNKMAKVFGGGGFFIGNEISEQQMKNFIEHNYSSFELLAHEHIKYINHLKQNEIL
jgi:hypothetical protein